MFKPIRELIRDRTPMAQEFDSLYRVIGFADRGQRMGLYDIPRDDLVWVNTVGYPDEIHSELEELESGNVVKAAVTDAGRDVDNADEDDEYWNLTDFEIKEDTRLYFVTTDDYTPGPVNDFWESRDPNQTLITAGRDKDPEHRDVDDDEEYWYELHVQQQFVENEQDDAEDGETIDVYNALQYGELLSEPLFAGESCEYLTDGADAIVVVNPEEKDYIAMYVFPSKNDKYKEIWGTLYEYVEENMQ